MSSRFQSRVAIVGWLALAALVTALVFQLPPLVDYFPRSLDYLSRPREFHLARRWQADNILRGRSSLVAQTPPDTLIVLPPMSGGSGAIGNTGLTDYLVFPRRPQTLIIRR